MSRLQKLAAGLAAVYVARFLVVLLSGPPPLARAYYISIRGSPRQCETESWFEAQRRSFPVPLTYVPGVVVDKGEYERLRQAHRAPDTLGQAGCRLSHLQALRNITGQPDGWYLVVEDDVGGSLRHALSVLHRVLAFVPTLQALNLYSPPLAERHVHHAALPIFSTRTTAYAVTPAGAARMIDTIERRPDLHVDESLSPLHPSLHWLFSFFGRGWAVAGGLERRRDAQAFGPPMYADRSAVWQATPSKACHGGGGGSGGGGRPAAPHRRPHAPAAPASGGSSNSSHRGDGGRERRKPHGGGSQGNRSSLYSLYSLRHGRHVDHEQRNHSQQH